MASSTSVAPVAWPAGEIARDVARGGLAGLVAGIIVAGIGGRVVMRVAALLVPSADGSLTENGNRIGEITAGGSVALIVFVGLLGAVFLAVVWVVISPWLPGRGLVKGLVAAPVAVALGAVAVIDRNNVDFVILERDALVVASLLMFVALAGPVLSVTDAWLDRRLPHPSSEHSTSFVAYSLFGGLGALLGGFLAIGSVFGNRSQGLGLTLVLVGLATLVWWRERYLGRTEPSRVLTLLARGSLVAGVIVGYLILVPELIAILRIG